jgi:hypothetical protein
MAENYTDAQRFDKRQWARATAAEYFAWDVPAGSRIRRGPGISSIMGILRRNAALNMKS